VFHRYGDLLLGITLTLLLIGQTVFGILPSIFQAIIAGPFLLFVPGYALITALIPNLNISRLERFVYAIGLSLAVIILSGLVLNITSWGLQQTSWLLTVTMITIIASAIGILRRKQIPSKESTSVRFYLPLRHGILLALAIVVIGLALKLTLTPQSLNNIQGYTSLWIVPEPMDQPDTFLVGIHSQELENTQFNLKVTYNHSLQQEWSDISLTPGDNWQQSITLPAGQGVVEADLYRASDPSVVYRRVSIPHNQ
jgi:hypothetical protein